MIKEIFTLNYLILLYPIDLFKLPLTQIFPFSKILPLPGFLEVFDDYSINLSVHFFDK